MTPRPLSTARSILYSAVIFVAFFGSVEASLRLVGIRKTNKPRLVVRAIDTDIQLPFMQSDPELFWVPRPGWEGLFLGKKVRINSTGLRGPELRRDGGTRILCLGDSVTFGYGLADEETYPAALGRRLDGSVEVINGGVTGYTSDQVQILLRRIGPQVRPSLVLVLIGWNDSTTRALTDREAHQGLRVANFADELSDRSYLFRALSNVSDRRSAREREPRRDRPRVRPEEYRENLAGIHATARELGARLALIALPYRQGPGLRKLSPEYPQLVRSTAADLGVPLLEVGALGEQATAPNERYFIDTLHFSPDGAELFADELARQLKALPL